MKKLDGWQIVRLLVGLIGSCGLAGYILIILNGGEFFAFLLAWGFAVAYLTATPKSNPPYKLDFKTLLGGLALGGAGWLMGVALI